VGGPGLCQSKVRGASILASHSCRGRLEAMKLEDFRKDDLGGYVVYLDRGIHQCSS
jgi:hypothetical protein